MDSNYQRLVEEIADKIIKNINSNCIRKSSWGNGGEIDYSFGGTLKSFTRVLDLDHMDIIISEFKKGEGLKKHYHKDPTEEVYYILEGEAEITISDKKVIAKKGDILSISPGTAHWPVNNKDQICRILFILSPKEKEKPILLE